MDETQHYEEEAFGILTEDELYLDCILVKPPGLQDEELRALRVWVPRYPLTKSSVITCARQEVQSYPSDRKIAHLVFDLRGTGYSEGEPGGVNFDVDLESVRLWAQERFGTVSLAFLGTPRGAERVNVLPIRPSVIMEMYEYRTRSKSRRPPLLYLATYGNFDSRDDAICRHLARAGYPVYGLDPLRYLLHASAPGRVGVLDLWQDLRRLLREFPRAPIVIGQPVSAGLALLWASGVEEVRGVIAIGRTQMAFKPHHIFKNDNPHTFFLSRYVHRIAPRPVVYVIDEAHPLGGDEDELAPLYQISSGGPRQLLRTAQLTPDFLLKLLVWMQKDSSR